MFDLGNVKVTTPPTSEPVSLDFIKTYLKVDGTTEDALITVLITAARQVAERYCQIALLPQTITETFPRFYSYGLRPTISPLISVEDITYLDLEGETETLSTDIYGVDNSVYPPHIFRIPYNDFPQTYAVPNAVTVEYIAGFADADAVPNQIKMAIALMVTEWYDNRSDGVRNLPTASQMLLDQYRVHIF
jgi:uncharacterized phiE125 gp8 family phage protein